LENVRRTEQTGLRETRFSRVLARDSLASELLQGCPVVTATGMMIGRVETLLIDRRTRQLRYVTVLSGNNDASIAIPWHTLYFDAALARLIFFTFG